MAPPIYSGTQENTPGTTYSAGAFQGYTGKPGQLFIPATKFVGTVFALTRAAKGNWYYFLGASTTGQLVADLGLILSQILLPPTPNFNVVKYNQGNSGQGIGVAINSVNAFYTVEGVALTSGTLGISQTIYTTAASQPTNPTVTDILAPTNLTLAGAGGNMSNTLYTPAVTTPLSTINSEILLELNAVTAAGGDLKFFGVALGLTYNY